MNVQREITPTITVADQPTEDDLRALKHEGYAAVVNLRNEGEPEQPLSTAAEGDNVREIGMDYHHLGVGAAPLTEAGVAAFCDFMEKHAGEKVLVHCRKGGRAAALVLIRQAKAQGWRADEAVSKGRALGLEVDGGLKGMVESYLREHP